MAAAPASPTPTPEWTPQGEASLLARLRRGEDAAYEELVRGLSPRLLATARRFLPDESDANDALQDAFLSAFKALDRFDGASRLSTWLHRIVVNACLMKLRARGRRDERRIDDMLPKFDGTGHAMEPPSPWPDESMNADRREVRELVRAAISELPDDFRNVLMIRDIEGLDTAEAAVVLGLSEANVKTRLHRARQALRELLDQRLREPARANAGGKGL